MFECFTEPWPKFADKAASHSSRWNRIEAERWEQEAKRQKERAELAEKRLEFLTKALEDLWEQANKEE